MASTSPLRPEMPKCSTCRAFRIIQGSVTTPAPRSSAKQAGSNVRRLEPSHPESRYPEECHADEPVLEDGLRQDQ